MRGALLILAVAVLAAEPCRNLVRDSNWSLPPFAKPEDGAVVVEGRADGAIAQLLERPSGLAGGQVVAIATRVESAHGLRPRTTTSRRALGRATSLVNAACAGSAASRAFTCRCASRREAASGAWKRFVSPPMPVWKAWRLYPHFAFWGRGSRRECGFTWQDWRSWKRAT